MGALAIPSENEECLLTAWANYEPVDDACKSRLASLDAIDVMAEVVVPAPIPHSDGRVFDVIVLNARDSRLDGAED